MNTVASSPLWAITSYYNPMRYHRRLDNYRRFRSALDIPLATVELGFDGQWELEPGDADIYLRVGHGDVLWQKERLLNVILKRLPRDCIHVAWLDCDLLFSDTGWPQRANDRLHDVPLLQLYSAVRYLARDATVEMVVDSVTARIRQGQSPASVLRNVIDRTGGSPTVGFAWAARRALLDKHGLYDACIIGGGDTALACAAFGFPETAIGLHGMNAHQQRRYIAWANRFHADVRNQVGVLSGEIHHLWHGELADRRTGNRHVGLAEHDFDPQSDISLGTDGAWRWASDKPELHSYLRNYFHQRNEDGAKDGIPCIERR